LIEMLLRKLFVSSVASLLTLIGYHLIQWEFFEHPKYLRKTEKRLKYLQQMVSRQKKGFRRRRKAVAMFAKCHEYIANQRRDTAHENQPLSRGA
jgi:transposase